MQIVSRKEAEAKGLTRYFTGRPCPRGHVAERWVANKSCAGCKSAWRKENPDKIQGQRTRHRKKYPERARAAVAKSAARARAKDPATFKRKAATWAKRWRDSLPPDQRYLWAKQNPESARASRIAANEKRRSCKKGVGGHGVTREDIQRLTEEQLGFCAYCFERRPLTLDHVHPLSLGGAHDPENVVMACKPCNSSKHAKPLLYWLATR